MINVNGAVEGSVDAKHGVSEWMARNLVMQGYCLHAQDWGRLTFGLRFATGLCFALVALALGLESSILFVTLAMVSAAAGLAPGHPFDLLWNQGVRHAFGAPPLPPTPVRRRQAFKIGAMWLFAVAALFAAGLSTAALTLGGALQPACGLVTASNFCLASFLPLRARPL